MTTLEKEFLAHKGAAGDCLDEKRKIEFALEESRQLEDLAQLADAVVTHCVKGYEEFALFRAKVDLEWSKHPELYSPKLHRNLRSAYQKFHSTLDDLKGLFGHLADHGVYPAQADRVRDICATLASIHAMDNMEMPAHMVEITEEAVKAYESGEDVGDEDE